MKIDVHYWKYMDHGKYMITKVDEKEADHATVCIIDSNEDYCPGFEIAFDFPTDKVKLEQYIMNLRIAYSMGRTDKAKEIINTVKGVFDIQ